MVSPDLYRQWRTHGGAALAFQEARRTGGPPERWLQELWAHQRLRRDEARTTAGQRLVILHPGFWNREAGPDFLRAVVQIGDGTPISGDIEIDLAPQGWKAHHHAGNPAYANVVLHVVWFPPASPPERPTLVLQDLLDAPAEELESWIGGAGESPYPGLQGQCAAPLRELAPETLGHLLRQAALVRLQTKALLFRARARVTGWHQALWEGVFRALGYKHNAWPMQRLAELLPTLAAHPVATQHPRETWEARLLGLSGLLPGEPRSGTYARRLWDLWWREREAFHQDIVPAFVWRLNGVRPANHPQRRLALAAAWFEDARWIERLEAWFRAAPQGPAAERDLDQALRPETRGFWKRHYTLTSRELPRPLPLLGSGRSHDLVINAILPWFWARADAGTDPSARAHAERLYLEWSPGEDNATLKLARSRLFGDETLPLRRTAALQQGLLQIVRDFCGYANALCDNCRFPELAGTLRSRSADPAP